MNPLDIIFAVILLAAIVFGLKVGLLGAIYSVVLVIVGWYVSATFGHYVGERIDEFIEIGRYATLLSYILIYLVVLFVGKRLWTVLSKALSLGTLGLSTAVDRIGGVALGLLLGAAAVGALIVGLLGVARITDALDATLADSTTVDIVANLVESAPGGLLGLVPESFQFALDSIQDKAG